MDAALFAVIAAAQNNFGRQGIKSAVSSVCPFSAPFGVQAMKEGHHMKSLFIASTALMLFASPASAQLLGGGGGGGAFGGGLGGALGNPMGSLGSTTRGAFDGAASASGSQSVNRRSGSVRADRSASGSIAGTLDSTTDQPSRSLSGSSAGNASGSAGGNADAQLIGTDALRGATSGATRSARDATSRVRGDAENSAGMTSSVSGMTSGTANGSAAGDYSGALGQLALAGTTAASGDGSFDVAPGMAVVNRGGRAIGSVRSVATDAKGRVESVLVTVGDRTASIPAGNFTGSGSVLVSAMGKGDLKDTANEQRDNSGSESADKQ